MKLGSFGRCALIASIAGSLAMVVSGAGTATASLPQSVVVTSSTQSLTFPAAPQVTFTATVSTGASPAEFDLSWTVPSRWSATGRTPAAGLTSRGFFRHGFPLYVGAPTLTGPGEVEGFTVNEPVAKLAYLIAPPSCNRPGTERPYDRARLRIPPESVSQVVIPARMTAPPWVGIDYSPEFTMANLPGSGPSSVTPLGSVPIGVGGPFGVAIDLNAGPRRSAESNRSPALKGVVSPPVAGIRVTTRAIRLKNPKRSRDVDLETWDAKNVKRLGSGLTGANGKFRIKPRRMPDGRYAVLARSFEPGSGLVPDWNCGGEFTIGESQSPKRRKKLS
jgi:hypothetical protein